MTVTALVMVDGVDQSSGTLLAMVGTEVRGLQDTPDAPVFGPYAGRPLFQLTVHADGGGESVGFQIATGGSVVSLVETLSFVVDGNVGSAVAPLVLTGAASALSPPQPSPAESKGQ